MILLNPSLGFISEIGSEKGHCADAPPHLSPLCSIPSYIYPPPLSLLFTPLSLSLSLSAFTQQRIGDLLSPTISSLCSLGLCLPSPALGRNKFVMKMGKNDHHGPARETQGESDIIPPPWTPPPPPHSHLGWRQWDACATNHLYTLISASGPRCCLLLSEQMTFRKRSELGGRDEEMGR